MLYCYLYSCGFFVLSFHLWFYSNHFNRFYNSLFCITKDVRELSWMSHRVMRFWFLLNFLFISAFFDILALLSISPICSSGISGWWKSSCSDIPKNNYQIWLHKLNLMYEELSYQIINISTVNQAVFCYY